MEGEIQTIKQEGKYLEAFCKLCRSNQNFLICADGCQGICMGCKTYFSEFKMEVAENA